MSHRPAETPRERKVRELAEQLCVLMIDDDEFCWDDGGREQVEALLWTAVVGPKCPCGLGAEPWHVAGICRIGMDKPITKIPPSTGGPR